MTDAKVQEALEHIRNAEKSLKTSFFKWSADYDIAADEYIKAATLYRNMKNYEQSRENYLKASDCHKKNMSLFNAAKNFEQAILMSREMGDFQKIPELADKAWRLYQENGNFDAAISCLEKTSKFIEDKNLTKTIYFLNQAAELSYVQNNAHQAADFKNRTAKHYISLRMYQDAVDALCKSVQYSQESGYTNTIGRTVFGLILLELALEDLVAAEKILKEFNSYCDSSDSQLLMDLLDAFNHEDREQIIKILKDPFIQHLDFEFAHLAKIIPLPKADEQKKSTNCDSLLSTIGDVDDLC